MAEKLSVHRLAGDLPEPKAYPTLGWKAGVEFSYHFCDYFGVVANFAFQDKFTGYYTYRLHQNEFGAMSYRHNYLGLEFSYSHCFKTREERIKRRLDKCAQEGD